MAAKASDEQVQSLPRARARATYVRVTPRKARRVVDLIRGLPAGEALAMLRFAPQAASEPIAKVVGSAVANAENNLDLDPESLVISRAYVDEGPTLKRYRPRSHGRPGRINKRTSHITVELESITVEPGRRGSGSSRRPQARKSTSANGRAR